MVEAGNINIMSIFADWISTFGHWKQKLSKSQWIEWNSQRYVDNVSVKDKYHMKNINIEKWQSFVISFLFQKY